MKAVFALVPLCLWLCSPPAAGGQAEEQLPTPLRQSKLTPETTGPPQPLSLRDASRDDRWLGLSPRDIRWAADGSGVYFRWHRSPSPQDDPDADPWFWVDREGRGAREVPLEDSTKIPSEHLSWSDDGRRAAWVAEGRLYVYDAESSREHQVRDMVSTQEGCRWPRMSRDGRYVDFMVGQDLYRYDIGEGRLRQLTRKYPRASDERTELGKFLETQQLELFEHHRRTDALKREAEARARRRRPQQPQPIPVEPSMELDRIQVTPGGRFITFTARKRNDKRPSTRYMDFVAASGYAEVHEARSKVGEPQDELRFGVVRNAPTVAPDEVEVRWVELPEAGQRGAVVYGPYWNLEATRGVVQALSRDHKDLWIAELDLETGGTTIVAHDHDDRWLGGPPIQVNYFRPALLEWLPGDRFVFASERSGWSHLYLVEADKSVRALTSGNWEVRGAELSRDRSSWLIRASREHPCEDHLYVLPAAGGELRRLTSRPGRSEGLLSPDGKRVALLFSDSVHMPDLYLRGVEPGGGARRVTVSGTDAYYRHPLIQPQVVSFPHEDGRPLWAALYEPERPNHAGILHIHGGGYRQFSHRGWSVYGYALHLGTINYLVQQGYTVLDFDYRGSAGFGRDYRTDIYRSMGMRDVDGMVTGAHYLEREHGIDPSRVGVYGISYGGFATLMALFRYPGVFAAGVADAAVTDWVHYNHVWTSRVLNLPYDDEEAYRRSSPIYYAEGLEDPLLVVHGLVDDNVHFQDAARLVERLIELEKDFDVMFYPLERHVIQSESSRLDYVKRLTAFFEKHLLKP